MKHHNLDQAARVERLGSRIEADIGGNNALRSLLIEALKVRTLRDEAALVQYLEEIGIISDLVGHSFTLLVETIARSMLRKVFQ